jgi:[ribosomal protein S18]-alanine N-acetyltransferase
VNTAPLIRDYSTSDRESLLHIFDLNCPQFFAPEEKNHLIQYLANELEIYFVLEADGIIAGSGGINFANQGTVAVISWDMIHPDYKGKHFGTRLLHHRLEVIRLKPGIRRIIVRTSQLSWPFYEKNGFRLLYSEKDYWAPGFDLYHMEIPA